MDVGVEVQVADKSWRLLDNFEVGWKSQSLEKLRSFLLYALMWSTQFWREGESNQILNLSEILGIKISIIFGMIGLSPRNDLKCNEHIIDEKLQIFISMEVFFGR